MEERQQAGSSIFDFYRRALVERLEILQKFEKFLLQLPEGAYTVEQQAVMAEDFSIARAEIAILDNWRQAAEEKRLMEELNRVTEKQQKSSRKRRS